MLRGVRGAITVPVDSPAEILAATRELLLAMTRANRLEPSAIASIIFTTTPDLRSEFPAAAARSLGWNDLALLGAVEMDKPGALPRCIRILMHAEMEPGARPVHVYLREAASLRPDLACGGQGPER